MRDHLVLCGFDKVLLQSFPADSQYNLLARSVIRSNVDDDQLTAIEGIDCAHQTWSALHASHASTCNARRMHILELQQAPEEEDAALTGRECQRTSHMFQRRKKSHQYHQRMTYYNCNKKSHFAANCREPPQTNKDGRALIATVAPVQMTPLDAQIPPPPQAEEQNLPAKLANMSEQEQKQHCGELLYPQVRDQFTGRFGSQSAMKLASKVTGMLLEMDTHGLLYLLEHAGECSSKIEEALIVLRRHHCMPEGCA